MCKDRGWALESVEFLCLIIFRHFPSSANIRLWPRANRIADEPNNKLEVISASLFFKLLPRFRIQISRWLETSALIRESYALSHVAYGETSRPRTRTFIWTLAMTSHFRASRCAEDGPSAREWEKKCRNGQFYRYAEIITRHWLTCLIATGSGDGLMRTKCVSSRRLQVH